MTFGEVLETNDKEEQEVLKVLLNNAKGINTLKGKKSKKLTDLKLGEVEQIRQWFKEGNALYIISFLTGLGWKDILSVDHKEGIVFFRWVISELERIGNMEKVLSEKNDEEAEGALLSERSGSKEMEKFSVLNEVDMLAKGDVLKWDEIMKLNYMVVYTKILMIKTSNRIEMKKNKIRNEEAKQRSRR